MRTGSSHNRMEYFALSEVLASLIIALACLGLWFYGRPAYRRYQETRALEQARQCLAQEEIIAVLPSTPARLCR